MTFATAEPKLNTSRGAMQRTHRLTLELAIRKTTAWWFLLPALALIGVFVLYPLLDTVRLSFTDFDGVSDPQWVGGAQYAAAASDPVFWQTLRNSFLVSLSSTLLLVCLPLPVAYWLHRHVPMRRFLRSAFYIPVLLPIIVSALAWRFILADGGALDWALMSLGVIQTSIDWLGDPRFAIWMVVLVILWRAFGIYMLIYLAGLSALPEDIFEAALIDGAGPTRTFFTVVVPLMGNSIMLAGVLAFTATMRLFDEVFVMTRGGPANASKNSAFYVWEQAFSYFNFGYASAVAVVLLVVVVVLVAAALLLHQRRSLA